MRPEFQTEAPAISRDEGIALVAALAAHALLVAALTLGAPGKTPAPPPARMTVTISNEVAEQSSSPDPNSAAAPEIAPDLGEPQPQPLPEPMVQPQVAPQPPAPQPAAAQPRPAPRPAVIQTRPQPRPAQAQPRPAPPKAAPPRPAPRDTTPRRRPDAPAGGSRIGSDFLKGVPAGTQPGARGNPADSISPQAIASARQTIGAEVLPFWNRCSVDGVDIEKLSVRIVMHLDRSGKLLSMDAPDVTGRTASNAPQVARFAECAQSAIRSASPFNLPAASYDFWKDYPVRLRKTRVN